MLSIPSSEALLLLLAFFLQMGQKSHFIKLLVILTKRLEANSQYNRMKNFAY